MDASHPRTGVVGTRTDYFRERRAGRGRNIGRAERAAIWQLVEHLPQRLDPLGRQTWDQVAERAARLEMGRGQRILGIAQQREEAGGLDNIPFRTAQQDGGATATDTSS